MHSIISTSILAILGLASHNVAARIDLLTVSLEAHAEAQRQLTPPLDFGNIMGLAAFGDCTINPLSPASCLSSSFTTIHADASVVVATSSGCTINGKSKLGHHVIAGAAIKVTLVSTTGGTDFNFAQTGVYDETSDLTADTLTAIVSDTQTKKQFKYCR